MWQLALAGRRSGATSPTVPAYVMEWLELEEEMFRRGGEFRHDPSDAALYGEAA